MNVAGVYRITNLLNNRHYIGVSKTVKSRLTTHKRKLRNGNHPNKLLQKDFKKYKGNFEFALVEKVRDVNSLAGYEERYIRQFNSFSSGYNRTTSSGYSPVRSSTGSEYQRAKQQKDLDNLRKDLSVMYRGYERLFDKNRCLKLETDLLKKDISLLVMMLSNFNVRKVYGPIDINNEPGMHVETYKALIDLLGSYDSTV